MPDSLPHYMLLCDKKCHWVCLIIVYQRLCYTVTLFRSNVDILKIINIPDFTVIHYAGSPGSIFWIQTVSYNWQTASQTSASQ